MGSGFVLGVVFLLYLGTLAVHMLPLTPVVKPHPVVVQGVQLLPAELHLRAGSKDCGQEALMQETELHEQRPIRTALLCVSAQWDAHSGELAVEVNTAS